MSSSVRRAMGAGTALAMAAALLVVSPGVRAQTPDSLTLDLVTSADLTFDTNAFVWCDDNRSRSSKVPVAKGECNFPSGKGPLSLRSQQAVVATVSTASGGAANFSITGQCAVGTSSYDSSSTPSTTTQVASTANLYVTVLAQGTECVLTGSTPGNASFAPATFTYSITSPINYDAIVLNVASVGTQTYGTGVAYWCDDEDAKNYDPKSSTNVCNFSTEENRLQLSFQESISATLFTSSNNPATFSVTGNCTVGSSAWDPSSAMNTSVQVQAGGKVYLTALQGSGECVMTGTTPGGGSLSPGSFPYTVGLALGAQAPTASLPSRKQMRVGQTLRLQGADGIQTNAGQDISWRVLRSSRKNCRLIERSNGAAVLRATSRGACVVQARAQGVPAKWSSFSQSIRIRVR